MWPMLGWLSEAKTLASRSNRAKAIRILGERLGQDFEGHVPVEFRVPGPIHLAHAAFADLGGDLIGAERGAGLQRQG